MAEQFDLYCTTKFSLTESRFARVCAVDPVVRLIGCQHRIDENGFLGVALPHLEALWLVKVLRRLGIETYPVSEKYKLSTISEDKARQAAQDYIQEKRGQGPQDDYHDVEPMPLSWWLSKIAFGFFSKSDTMMQNGVSPGGITVSIDRASGLVLHERELLHAELSLMLTA